MTDEAPQTRRPNNDDSQAARHSAPPRAAVPLRGNGGGDPRPARLGRAAAAAKPVQQYVLTAPSPCPYLPGLQEQKLVTAIDPGNPEVYDRLHSAGFRRSHEMAYRPVCATCNKCQSLRIDVAAFRPNRTQRKLLNKHSQLSRAVADHGATQEGFELFHHYTRARHHDGEMASMDSMDFASLVLETSVDTHVIEWRDPGAAPGESLRAASLVDILRDGLSMVYSFYDCEQPSNSYGTFMILSLMEVCARLNLPYLYLGYWVQGSPSMDYKAQFSGTQVYGANGWQQIEK